MSSECQPYINTQSRLRDSRPSSSPPSLAPSFSSWTILAPSVFPFSLLAAFSFHVTVRKFSPILLYPSASTPHYSTILKNALLTGFLRISRVTTTLFLIGERFRRTFPFNTRILYIYVYIQASRLNRRMNQIETFSFPPTFLIYIYINTYFWRVPTNLPYTTRKQYYLGQVLSWRRNGRPDYYAVFAP